MTTNEIRQAFLEFFKSKGHTIVPSDSLVPKDDPTLLFTGAGMNQFKEKFLGRNITYTRAASCQKCLRTGDLENVGKTPGHHTFFEMLGNFSFGDYFKKDAIVWAWEFLTKKLKIKSQKLWVSVYQDDDEAYNIWKDAVKIPQEKIIRLGAKDNFWPSEAPTKGPNGPCGPCSEIFYDWGEDVGCRKTGCSPACDCGRFVEVWNLVFTQFDRQKDGSLESLPNKNIDTGMGLERLASVMQGVHTNFEIDIFKPIVEEIRSSIVHRPSSIENEVRRTKDERRTNAIADHIRAVTFAIADGVMPSNEEKGYVVRKIIRRSIMHSKELDITSLPFLYKLVDVVAEVMKEPYPELKTRRDDIAQVVKKEEESCLFVLDTQLPKVEDAFRNIRGIKDDAEIAEAAFNFYDTYGVPYEILETAAKKFNLRIDKNKFENLLNKQRELSRGKTKIKGEIFSETFAKKVEALDLKTEFLGYEKTNAEAKVAAVLEGGEVILDRTPFYGESGGQVGDWGRIETASGAMEVRDAKRYGETIVHIGKILKGRILKGEKAKVYIDEATRGKVMANHTATHLLQAALRNVLGEHVHQTGSMVDKDRLRFDFTHIKKMDERELKRVEETVNENIKKRIPVKKEIKDLESAKREGATALFGEKYEKKVRVVTIGDVSKELCGGTHLDNTGEIEIFKIISESSIASGIRRIEALTGDEVRKWMEREEEAQSAKLKSQSEKEKEKKARAARLKEEIGRIDSIMANGKIFNGAKIIFDIIDGLNTEGLRVLSDKIQEREKSVCMILSARKDGKAEFVVKVTDDLIKRGLRAGDIAKDLSKIIGGSGGGRPDFAQGGGKETAKLEEAVVKILGFIKEKLA